MYEYVYNNKNGCLEILLLKTTSGFMTLSFDSFKKNEIKHTAVDEIKIDKCYHGINPQHTIC